METNQNGTFQLTTNDSSVTNHYPLNWNPNSTTGVSTNSYMQGKIVKTEIFEDRIEIIYRCEPMYTTWPGTNYPKIYKEVYSRTDGSMQKIDGKYVPSYHVEEDYEF
jgi:hypothetical protein